MSSCFSLSFLRKITLVSASVLLVSAAAGAQSAPARAASDAAAATAPAVSSAAASAAGSSSSLQFLAANQMESQIMPSAPAPAMDGGGANAWPAQHSWFSHLAFETGGGFNAPTSGSTPYITWGGNFTAGVGYRFTPRLSLMAEYQIIDDKLPGGLIAETRANGGNAHIWSFTLDPVLDLFPGRTNDFYVTGGGGFYRKMTNFTDPALVDYCDYYYYYCGPGVANVVVGHFSSNQGGWNIGAGYTHKIAGTYDNGRMKLYAEARYLDVLNPAVIGITPNGLGTTTVGADTKLVPVTFGVRW